ncbi:hypothetical protein GBAR_LOCUS15132, partial [Geodia barretti]
MKIPLGLSRKPSLYLRAHWKKILQNDMGGGEGDADEVQSHVFFESITGRCYNKRITPPFIP